MKQRIASYQQDEGHHWVAVLECSHTQHLRHNPPWVNRPWVMTDEGRERHIGAVLNCKKCEAETPL